MRTLAPEADRAPATPERLAALPALFRKLMEQPLSPLTRARLPARSAVYLFYQDDEPVGVGSPPHVHERRMLASSVRLSLSLSGRREADSDRLDMQVGPLRDEVSGDQRRPLAARWLTLESDDDRMLLELFAAQSLGLSVSHPRIRQGLAAAWPDIGRKAC